MARKKKIQKIDVGETVVQASSPTLVKPVRSMNQYQARASKPSFQLDEAVDPIIPLLVPPHPSNGLPSQSVHKVLGLNSIGGLDASKCC